MKKLDIRIDFEGMESSEPMKERIREKIVRLEKLVDENADPAYVEFWIKAADVHPHHKVKALLKVGFISVNAGEESADAYLAIDSVIDKLLKQYKKEKELLREKARNA